MITIEHIAVLLSESVRSLEIVSGETVVDATFGRGGHSKAFLDAVGPEGRVIALDVDPSAVLAAKELSEVKNFHFVRQNFRNVDMALTQLGIEQVHKVFFDLGVSSPQFDQGERGFSYRFDGPLDMRMDPSQEMSAARILNTSTEQELRQILWEYGEERWAKRIAQFMIAERTRSPLLTTAQLVDLIRAAIPKEVREKEDQHPARRTFQALRIAVNDELGALSDALAKAVELLGPQGRIGCISFHSLEDRTVKQFFADRARNCICPPGIPSCVCGHKASLKVI
ncbi:MAG: 16S rRNA (cytosine(1402)-N(4))-methyltransferase RsmH, partial [Bacillota bacterium]|nr:16S rRNA (cytosine(1402)-N(4))-methyltransferase RsmH [Bacillota bacterium]